MILLKNQIQAKSHLLPYKVGALFMEAGTGKTRVACELINNSQADFVFWIGPLNTIRTKEGISSIKNEVEKWGINVPVEYIGIESIQSSNRIYLDLRSKVKSASSSFVVVDESLKIKNSESKRTKRLLELSEYAKYKFILNGTPISRNLLDLWAQMEFLSPKILSMKLTEFKNTFCEYTKITKQLGSRSYSKEYITGYENIDYLYSLIRNYVFECDLSLQIKQYYSEIKYTIDDEHKDEYQRLKKEFLDDEVLQWRNNNIFLEMTQKMQHVYCCTSSKFEVLDKLFTQIDESCTIIYCKYIDSREVCEKLYPNATVLSYQKESLGLNLQHLCNTVYFDKNWDYALRIQSGRRTFRTGQERDCRYWDLTGDVGLEKLIDTNIQKKIGMVEYFKGKTKEEIHEVL